MASRQHLLYSNVFFYITCFVCVLKHNHLYENYIGPRKLFHCEKFLHQDCIYLCAQDLFILPIKRCLLLPIPPLPCNYCCVIASVPPTCILLTHIAWLLHGFPLTVDTNTSIYYDQVYSVYEFLRFLGKKVSSSVLFFHIFIHQLWIDCFETCIQWSLINLGNRE